MTNSNSSNTSAVVAYLLGPIYLLLEKKDKNLRFYALQATFLWLVVVAANVILNLVNFWALTNIVGMVAFIVWLYLTFKAYQGEKIVLPVIGEYAQKYA